MLPAADIRVGAHPHVCAEHEPPETADATTLGQVEEVEVEEPSCCRGGRYAACSRERTGGRGGNCHSPSGPHNSHTHASSRTVKGEDARGAGNVNVLCYLLLTSGWVLIRMYVQNTNHPKPPTPQRSGKSKKSKSKNHQPQGPAAEEADVQREGGWGFGPQMLEALAARDVGGLPSGWGARYRVSADTANADTEPEPETRPEMEQLEPAAPGWGAAGATVNEGGWGFGPQMLEALAARESSGWGFLPPPPPLPPRPAAPTNNTDELEELVPTLGELLAINRERQQRQSARDDKSIAQHNANAFVQMGATGTRVPPGVWPPRYFVNEVMAGWGFLPPPPPPRPGAPNDNTDEEADMQPAPEKEPEAEVETATHHQVRTIHTPMPPPVQSKARMHAALAMSMYYATCC